MWRNNNTLREHYSLLSNNIHTCDRTEIEILKYIFQTVFLFLFSQNIFFYTTQIWVFSEKCRYLETRNRHLSRFFFYQSYLLIRPPTYLLHMMKKEVLVLSKSAFFCYDRQCLVLYKLLCSMVILSD